ncbi:MAG: phosphate propanoyltransferase, partial [Candidatus Caldatribacteriota bacterium]|nr:phosphate propanoyltransferase [Candidatus Caldatribacteriota bacterium]
MEDSSLSDYKDIIEVISKAIYKEVKPKEGGLKDFSIPVETSNHHVHLTRESLDILFRKGYELTKLRDLSQPGEFASNEQVNIV